MKYNVVSFILNLTIGAYYVTIGYQLPDYLYLPTLFLSVFLLSYIVFLLDEQRVCRISLFDNVDTEFKQQKHYPKIKLGCIVLLNLVIGFYLYGIFGLAFKVPLFAAIAVVVVTAVVFFLLDLKSKTEKVQIPFLYHW